MNYRHVSGDDVSTLFYDWILQLAGIEKTDTRATATMARTLANAAAENARAVVIHLRNTVSASPDSKPPKEPPVRSHDD